MKTFLILTSILLAIALNMSLDGNGVDSSGNVHASYQFEGR